MEHIWGIHNLKRNLSDGLVTTASFICKTSYLDENTRTVGEVNLTAKNTNDPDFINYDNLTEDTVLGWVTGSLNTVEIYSQHSASIAEAINIKNATTVGEGTPW